MALVTNFTERIEDISGSCSDANAVETFITDGCYDVINRVKAINPQKIDMFTTSHSLTTSSVSVTTERDIVSVYRKNYGGAEYNTNLLDTKNQGFENAITNASDLSDTTQGTWLHRTVDSSISGTIARTTATDSNRTGSYGGLLTANSIINRVFLNHPTVIGKSYRFSLYARVPSSNPIELIFIGASTSTEASSLYANSESIFPTSGGWTESEVIFTASSTKTYLTIYFQGDANDTGFIDDLSFAEKEAAGDYYPCRFISAAEGKYKVKNQNSIYYSNNYADPVYYFSAGSLFVVPTPDTNNPAEYTKIPEYTITNPASGAGASEIANFPTQYYEHVLTYAGIMNLQRQLRNMTDSLPTVPTFAGPSDFVIPSSLADVNIDFTGITAPTYVAPDVPTLSAANNVLFNSAVPTYTAPTVGGVTEGLTATITSGDSKTDVSDWFDVVGDFIQTEEDTELAQAQLAKIQAYISSYQSSQQDSINEFNEANTKYQAELQIAIQNAQQVSDTDAKKLQKFSTDIQHKTQIFTSELNVYQQKIQKALQTYQAETGYDVSKYSAELQAETARVTNQLQIDTQEYTSLIQNFKANLEKFNVDYRWKESQQKFLINRYEAMFVSEGIQARPQEG